MWILRREDTTVEYSFKVNFFHNIAQQYHGIDRNHELWKIFVCMCVVRMFKKVVPSKFAKEKKKINFHHHSHSDSCDIWTTKNVILKNFLYRCWRSYFYFSIHQFNTFSHTCCAQFTNHFTWLLGTCRICSLTFPYIFFIFISSIFFCCHFLLSIVT